MIVLLISFKMKYFVFGFIHIVFLLEYSDCQCIVNLGFSGEYWRFCSVPSNLNQSYQSCFDKKISLSKINDSPQFDILTVLDSFNKSASILSQMDNMAQIYNTSVLGMISTEQKYFEDIRSSLIILIDRLIKQEMDEFSRAHASAVDSTQKSRLSSFNNSNINDILASYRNLMTLIDNYQNIIISYFTPIITSIFNNLNNHKAQLTPQINCVENSLSNFKMDLMNRITDMTNAFGTINNDYLSLKNQVSYEKTTMNSATFNRATANDQLEIQLRDKISICLDEFDKNMTFLIDQTLSFKNTYELKIKEKLIFAKDDLSCAITYICLNFISMFILIN